MFLAWDSKQRNHGWFGLMTRSMLGGWTANEQVWPCHRWYGSFPEVLAAFLLVMITMVQGTMSLDHLLKLWLVTGHFWRRIIDQRLHRNHIPWGVSCEAPILALGLRVCNTHCEVQLYHVISIPCPLYHHWHTNYVYILLICSLDHHSLVSCSRFWIARHGCDSWWKTMAWKK